MGKVVWRAGTDKYEYVQNKRKEKGDFAGKINLYHLRGTPRPSRGESLKEGEGGVAWKTWAKKRFSTK